MRVLLPAFVVAMLLLSALGARADVGDVYTIDGKQVPQEATESNGKPTKHFFGFHMTAPRKLVGKRNLCIGKPHCTANLHLGSSTAYATLNK